MTSANRVRELEMDSANLWQHTACQVGRDRNPNRAHEYPRSSTSSGRDPGDENRYPGSIAGGGVPASPLANQLAEDEFRFAPQIRACAVRRAPLNVWFDYGQHAHHDVLRTSDLDRMAGC